MPPVLGPSSPSCRRLWSCAGNSGTIVFPSVKVIVMNHKIFNDAVHGHMTFDPLLIKIIDTVEFQRLRHLKQLGLAYLVYPSACHNRFEHCLGTCHMARKFLEALEKTDMEECFRPTEQEKLCVLIAALCHDLGHGPFSHMWEVFIEKARPGQPWKHEKASVEILDLILQQSEVKEMLKLRNFTPQHINLIKDLIDVPETIKPHTSKYFLTQIVSNKDNDIDVDKWDYILRDQKQLNVTNNFDPERLMNFAQVLRVRRQGEKVDRAEICYRDKEVQNIHDMLQARAVLHHKAYQHPVVQIVQCMVVDALLLANTACPEWELTNTTPENLKTLTDKVYQDIIYSKDQRLKEAKNLLERVETRRLYQKLFTYECTEADINEKKYKDLDKVANLLYQYVGNNNMESGVKREELEVLQIQVTMGSKYNNDGINCYKFTKNSKVPELIKDNCSLFVRSLSPVLKRQLLVVYKGPKRGHQLDELKIKERIESFFSTSNGDVSDLTVIKSEGQGQKQNRKRRRNNGVPDVVQLLD